MPDEIAPNTASAPADVLTNAAPAPDIAAPAPAAIPDTGSNISATLGAMAPFQAKEQAATQKAADIANTPPPPPAPHQRLMNMIAGLGIGLSAFGTALATHGEKGGAQEVEELSAARQQQQIQAQQAAAAQKNQQIQNQLMVADTNHKLAQNVLLLATIPTEMAKSDLEVKGAQQQQAVTAADFQASHGGMSPTEFSAAISDTAPATAASAQKNAFFVTSAQQQLDAGTKILGENDQYVKNLQAVMKDPAVKPKDLWTATSQLQNQLGKQKEATTEIAAKEAARANSIVGKLSTPEALAAPGAQAAIQAQIDNPNTDPKDVADLRKLLPQAAVAQFNAEQIKQREMRNQQIVNQGSSDAAGRELANRTLTLDELKSRSVTPDFIVESVKAAQKYDPTFKAPEAAAQARIAASPANSQFFGNTDSLLVKGGTLDQLEQAYAALGNTKIPVINKLDNLRKAAVGSGPLAAAYAAQLGVADDYSKVISGGSGSDTSRQQALDIMSVNLAPEARGAAIKQIRSTIESQRNGRVGTNPYMQDMYPDPSTRQETPGASGTQPATSVAPISKFAPDAAQPTRPASIPANRIHGNGPHGPGWYDPSIFGGK